MSQPGEGLEMTYVIVITHLGNLITKRVGLNNRDKSLEGGSSARPHGRADRQRVRPTQGILGEIGPN